MPKFNELILISWLKLTIESARLKKLFLKSDADICLEELSGRIDSIKELNSKIDIDIKKTKSGDKIKYNISRRIREILCQQKSESSLKYTGCSLEKLKIHLESTMEDGMHWKNYGTICVFSLQKFKSILVA